MTNTISTDVTYANGITLGSNGYSGNLTITTTGTVQPSGNGATAIYNSIAGYTVVNYGTVIGGGGGGNSGAGGAGVVLSAGTLTNDGQITGGEGARGGYSGGVAGGDGVVLSAGTLTNDGTITGGEGGEGSGSGGAGGDGVLLSAGTLTNDETITGGEGGGGIFGLGGAGGDGVMVSAGRLSNHGQITGGSGSSTGGNYGGAGGAGVALSAGTLTNDGTITGGGGGEGSSGGGAGGAGVVLGAGTLTNDGQITGGEGGYSFYGGAGGAGAVLSAGTLTNDGQITGGSGGRNAFGGRGAGGAGVSLDGGTLINAGTITGYGGDDAVRFGTQAATLIVDPGAVFNGAVVAQASVADVLMFAGDASVILDSEFIGFSTLDFAGGSNATISGTAAELASGQMINGFGGGDKIVLEDLVESSFTYVAGTGLELTAATDPTTLDFVGNYHNDEFVVSTDGTNTTISLCYRRGTHILAPTSEKRVEDLAIGDLVVTRFGGVQAIKWIGRQSFDFAGRDHAPVHFRPDSLGDGMPACDLFVSPQHSMLIGEALVLARSLVNGITITQAETAARVDYFQLDLGRHDCIIAEGAWSETYADAPGLRDVFHNAAEFASLYPDERPPEALTLCAPRPAHGAALYGALQPVVARAAATQAPGTLRGYVDVVENEWNLHGWAQDLRHPELPVQLDIILDSRVIGTVLACDHREDLHQAGIGPLSFVFNSPVRLRPDLWPTLHVRRSADGATLDIAPAIRGGQARMAC